MRVNWFIKSAKFRFCKILNTWSIASLISVYDAKLADDSNQVDVKIDPRLACFLFLCLFVFLSTRCSILPPCSILPLLTISPNGTPKYFLFVMRLSAMIIKTVELAVLQGFYSPKSRRLIGIGTPIINLRRSDDRLSFILGIPTPTNNGCWCMGIKGEMSGTVCVTFTRDMYIYIYMSCL